MEEQSIHSQTSQAVLPNLPDPVNGAIKTYDHPSRKFSGPYSAKTVFFYKEGDIYFTGLRVPVSKARYRTIDSLLDDLSSSISMPFGVRRVTTPYGKTTIENIDQFEHLGRYIVSSTKYVRPLNFSLLNKIRKARKERHMQTNKPGGTSFWVPTSPNFKAKLRISRTIGLSHLPPTAKQMLFVLNGKPSRIYRAVLNPTRNKTFEALLEEVSQGLNVAIFKIYAYNGKRLTTVDELMSLGEARVLAVPRNERPKLKSQTLFPSQKAFPSVSMSKPSNSTGSSSALINDFGETKSSSYNTKTLSPDTDNSIEKKYLRKMRPIKKRPKLLPRNIRRPSTKKRRRSQGGSADTDQGNSDEKNFVVNETNSTYGNEPFSETTEEATNGGFITTDEYANSVDSHITSVQRLLEQQHEAASKIQTFYRKHRSEKQVEEDIRSYEGSSKSVEDKPRTGNKTVSQNKEEADKYKKQNQKKRCDENDKEKLVELSEPSSVSRCDHNNAAIKIQAAWKGYSVRKNFKRPTEQLNDDDPRLSMILEEDTSHCGSSSIKNSSLIENPCFSQFDASNSSNKQSRQRLDDYVIKNENHTTYTVSVLTGNRWAAEMDKDLYIELYGENGNSGRHTLRQDYINWLQTKEEKFRRNHIDSFLIETVNLGTLTKVVIGHENYGYGAGVFIEQILVTENVAEGRQFLFQCNKWLDSGQVDGKTVRVLKTTAFYYISSIPADDVCTKGRWELIFHSGKTDGTGGTTSNLNIIGYGKDDFSASNKIYDSKLAKVPSTSLVQVDFGEIGDLLKIRIEIDGSGSSPDYFLEEVEMRDMDTDERMVSYVGKWLRWGSAEPNQQPFREFPVFRAAFEPLNIMTYEGKLRLSEKNRTHLASDNGFLQIFGEFGSSGRFPIKLKSPINKKEEISFKTEAVSVGLIRSVRLYVETDKIGEEIYEGLCRLQSIYDNTLKMELNTASNWIISNVLIRESQHTPYRFILQNSRVRTEEEDSDEIFKEVIFTGMEGLATKISKKKATRNGASHWCLVMKVANCTDLIPKVTLCSHKATTEMAAVDEKPSENVFCFEQRQTDDGLLLKVRVSIDDAVQVRRNSVTEIANTKDSLEILKMTLYDKVNGDELRFHELNAVLNTESVCEFPAIWPDISPLAVTIYKVRIKTGRSIGKFDVYINLIGTKGDIGFRKLKNKQKNLFEPDSVNEFSVSAVSIETPVEVEVVLRCKEQQVIWSCSEMTFAEQNCNQMYSVHFKQNFSTNLKSQRAKTNTISF